MKYIYYIIVIMVIFSAVVGYGLFKTKVEISKPALIINDRIITKDEYKELLAAKPIFMPEGKYIDSLIMKQILIQEAIKENINKEESFRKSVQNFYEQSLIKILLDRKQKALEAGVTDQELSKYENLMHMKVYITKVFYESLADVEKDTNKTFEQVNEDFVNLSDELKFVVLNLNIGQHSDPVPTYDGVVVYRLDKIEEKSSSEEIDKIDMKRVSQLIQGKKKQQQLDAWTDMLKENAKIWRQK